MTNKNLNSSLLFGFTLFVGLLPLTVFYSENGLQLLIDSSFRYTVWSLEVVVVFILLFSKITVNKNQLIALSGLFLMVPLTFTFNNDGITFLILNKYISSVLSWVISGILVAKLFFAGI